MFTYVSMHPRDKSFLFQRLQLCLFWCKHTMPLYHLRLTSSPYAASCCRTGSPSPTRARSHQPARLHERASRSAFPLCPPAHPPPFRGDPAPGRVPRWRPRRPVSLRKPPRVSQCRGRADLGFVLLCLPV